MVNENERNYLIVEKKTSPRYLWNLQDLSFYFPIRHFALSGICCRGDTFFWANPYVANVFGLIILMCTTFDMVGKQVLAKHRGASAYMSKRATLYQFDFKLIYGQSPCPYEANSDKQYP